MSVVIAARPVSHLSELLSYRQLLVNLTLRDLRLKYKGSALGVLWSLLNPLIMMAIYTLVFSLLLRAVVLPHYWALVLGGLLGWIFFTSALTYSTGAFINNGGLITKVHFPIEVLPLAGTLAHFINYLIMLALLLVVLGLGRVGLGPSLVLLPVVVLALLAFTVGLGLFLATVTVYFRDVEHLVGLGLTAWFYVTPVLYPLDPRVLPAGADRFLPYLNLNPLSWFFETFHSILYYGTWPDPTRFDLMLAAALVALAGGYLFYVWLRPRIPEEV